MQVAVKGLQNDRRLFFGRGLHERFPYFQVPNIERRISKTSLESKLKKLSGMRYFHNF